MKNKIILTIILGIFLLASLGFASATTFKQYQQNATLKVPCSYNGTNCDDTAVVNLSIIYPNGTTMVNNKLMNNTGNGMPSYEIPNANTLGIYSYKTSATQNGISGSYTNVFDITTTGIDANNKIPIFLLIFSVVLLVLGFWFESPPIGFFSGILFMLTGVYLMIYGFGDINDLYTRAFAYVVIALGMITSVLAGFSMIED
jgi:hypothetical protein